MFSAKGPEQQAGFFGENRHRLKICLVLMFIMAALIRRDEIKAPGHLVEREYNSAIFARAFYFENNGSVETWRVKNAIATRDRLPLLEPPLTEYLVSLIYRALGREEIWYARYLTGIFWLIGGIFMYLIAKHLLSEDAALFALGYYLFAPMGIIISRSFQPDSLMMMMLLVSLYCVLHYFERPTGRSLILAGIVTGFTLFLRPLVLFALLCAFLALSIHQKKTDSPFVIRRLLIFCILSLVIPVAYYGYRIYITGSLAGQADLSFRPYLLARWQFWLGWFHNGASVAGSAFLISAFFGFFLLRNGLARSMIIGLAIGDFIFGLFFTYHIHTHPYYHIQLFPIIGICAAQFLTNIAHFTRNLIGRTWWIPVTAAALVTLYFAYEDVQSTLYTPVFEDPRLAKEVGVAVGHSSHTVFVAYHYGLPLEYYGEFAGVPWPPSIDDPFYRHPEARELSVQERIDALGFPPEYYVITNWELYKSKHQDLQAYLAENCSIRARTDRYLVFGTCRRVAAEQN